MITEQDLAWMAAIIDIKGKVVLKNNKQRKTRQTVIMVETKELPIIKKLAQMTGTGPEYLAERPMPDFMRRGCIEHCPEQHVHLHGEKPNNMPAIARWTITGAGAAVIVRNIEPWLVSNGDYFRVMTELIIENSPSLTSHGIGAVLASIRRLKSLGWKLPQEYEDLLTEGALVTNGK